jgi:hypothetical protein
MSTGTGAIMLSRTIKPAVPGLFRLIVDAKDAAEIKADPTIITKLDETIK